MSLPKVEEYLRDKTFGLKWLRIKFVFLVLCGICNKEGPGTYLEIGAVYRTYLIIFFLEKELG
jgi:hypothetical protein